MGNIQIVRESAHMHGQPKRAADTQRHESSERHERSEEVPSYQDLKGIGLRWAGQPSRRASSLATPSYEPDHMDLGFGMKIAKMARVHIVSRGLMIASADGGCSGRIMDAMNRSQLSQEPANSHPQVSLNISPGFSTRIDAAPPHGTMFLVSTRQQRRWDLHELGAHHYDPYL